MAALRLPAFFENSPHSNVILTVGGGVFGQKDGLTPGAVACRQAVDAWKDWKSGQYGNISLNDGVIDFARTHEEIKGAFLDLDTLLPLGPNLFWVDTPGCAKVAVRDIYHMEFEIFQPLVWRLFYPVAVIIFRNHMCLGWQKVVPAPAQEILKKYHGKAIHMDYVFAIFTAIVCASFPVFSHLFAMSLCPPPHLLNLDFPLHLRLNHYWAATPGCVKVAVRDICYMELASFHSLAWGLFYAVAVIVCSTHLCLARQKAVTALAMAIPKQHRGGAIHMGYASAIFIAMAYASFPVYTHLFAMSSGSLSAEPAQL